MQIDATAISGQVPYFSVFSLGGLATDQVQPLHVLPGTFLFETGTRQYTFEVSRQDAVDYDTSLDGVLGGRGTNELVVEA